MQDNIVEKTALELIASGDSKTLEEYSKSIENNKNQMKIFLIEQAKRELGTIIKYINMLDKLQAKYEEKMDEYLDNLDNGENSNLAGITYFIDHISKCIDRSNSLLSKIIGDNKLMDIMFVDMSQNTTVNNSGNYIEANLTDSQSRQKVRNAISMIMSQIDSSSE